MSGVEAAGLALAILPLIVSAAEHYEDCFRPFLRYKKFAKEADSFRELFNVQKTIFRNQCGFLLEEIVDHDAALSILNGASHPSQSDEELDRQLGRLLGDSKESCAAVIEAIQDKLSDIESESQQLGNGIEQERQKATQSIGDKAWRSRVAKKLRFSFGKSSRLDQNLKAIRSLNKDFVTLSRQAVDSTVRRGRAPKALSQVSSMEIEKYQTIGQASCQVYEALGKACTKHTEHRAHFCVEVEQELMHGVNGSQFKFNLAFTHLNLVGSAQQDDLLWFVVNSIIGDDLTKPGIEGTVIGNHNSLAQSLKRQIEPAQAVTTKKQKKSVRFQSSMPASPPTQCLTPNSIPDNITLYDSMRKDLCDYLRRCVGQSVHEGVCLCGLKHSGSCKNLLYASSTAPCLQRRQATSLGQLISLIKKQGSNSKIPLHERVRLAKNLAITVLQYHATPWLTTSWRSEDVYFFGLENASSMQTDLSLPSPHLNVKVKGPNGQLSRASTVPPHNIARNTLLYSLAVIFLEIAHSSTFETLQRPSDLMNGQKNLYTDFLVARRLAKYEYSVLGPRYHKIVERLVECDFGCGDDLSSRQLQSAIHNEVVCQLEQLEQGLRKLCLGP